GHVVAVLANIIPVIDEFVAEKLFEMRADALKARNAVDNIAGEMKAVEVVQNGHVERRCRGALFLVAADMKILVIGAAISQPVNQPGIAVVSKDDWLIDGKERIEFAIRKAMRMFCGGL